MCGSALWPDLSRESLSRECFALCWELRISPAGAMMPWNVLLLHGSPQASGGFAAFLYSQNLQRGNAGMAQGLGTLPNKSDDLNSIPRSQVKVEEENHSTELFSDGHTHILVHVPSLSHSTHTYT